MVSQLDNKRTRLYTNHMETHLSESLKLLHLPGVELRLPHGEASHRPRHSRDSLPLRRLESPRSACHGVVSAVYGLPGGSRAGQVKLFAAFCGGGVRG